VKEIEDEVGAFAVFVDTGNYFPSVEEIKHEVVALAVFVDTSNYFPSVEQINMELLRCFFCFVWLRAVCVWLQFEEHL